MEEIKRVLFTKRRLLILLVLVLFCIYDTFSPLMDDDPFRYKDGWKPYLETYRDTPFSEIKADLNKITKGGTDFFALDTYGRMFQTQIDYLIDYPNFLENVQWQADTMLQVSIFQTDDKTVLKTAEDYKQMEGVELTIGMDRAVQCTMWDPPSDWLIAAYMLVIVFSFMAERKRGLWNLVCASAGGRTKLPVYRLICLFIAALTGAVLFTGIEIVGGWVFYGGFDELNRIVQSISNFKGLTIPMTIGQFWLFYTFLRFVGAFIIGMIFWLFLEMIPDRRLSVIAFALFTGVEYVLFTVLPGDYMLDTLNLFMCLSPRELVLSYEVLDPLGIPLGRIEVFLVFSAIIAVAAAAAILISSRYRKPSAGIAWMTRLADWWRKHTAAIGFHGRLFFHEVYKMLVTGRGAVVVLAALLIAYSCSESPYLGQDGQVSQSLETYYRQSQGKVTDDSYTYLQNQWDKLAQLKEEYAELQQQYADGKVSDLEYRALSLTYSDLGEKEIALGQFEKDLQTMGAMDNGYIMPHWVYAELFGIQSSTVDILQVVSFIAVSLMCVLYASTESSTGMTKARRATAGGRGKALLARYGAGIAFSALLSILIWVAQIWLLNASYEGLPFLEAPVCCLHYFEDMSENISIIGYWCSLVALRTALLSAWSVVLLWTTDRLQK